jgi:hypothetical protein
VEANPPQCDVCTKIATFNQALASGNLPAHLLSLVLVEVQGTGGKVRQRIADFCAQYESLQSCIKLNVAEALSDNVTTTLEHFVANPFSSPLSSSPSSQHVRTNNLISNLLVVTYNIWGGPTAKEPRATGLLVTLLAEEVDGVCLQEVTRETLEQLSKDSTIWDHCVFSDEPTLAQAAQSTFIPRAAAALGLSM